MTMNAVKYKRLVETLKRDIISGRYGSDNPLPSVRALIGRYGLSNTTVLHALDELVRMGLISRKQGRGTFVTDTAISRKIGLIVPGVACTDFFQPIISEINQLARENDYSLLFAEVFSGDREERIRQVRALAAEFIEKRVSGVIYEPLAEPGGNEANGYVLRAFKRAGIPVVLIDCDLRRRSLTKSLGGRNDRRGITSYLSNADMPIEEIVRSSGIEPNLDIIYAGVQPPNPTEMLLSQRLDELITELRQHYDYIVIDSVPAMTIADAMILDRIADLTIYVIRQGGLDRRLLPDIEQLYREHKFRNMGIVLNDVTAEDQGYGYGYEYGYYDGRHELSLWQRIKHKFGHKA